LKPRFQADNDLRSSIRAGVLRREPSVDFQSALAARLDGMPDPEVLQLAMAQSRILVSHDENSMPGHFCDFLNGGNRSPGVLMVPQGSTCRPHHREHRADLDRFGSGEWIDRIEWLPA
jgi:hypothetical protein